MTSDNRIIALIVASALFMQSIDQTVLGTALATIAGDLGVAPVRMHLTMTAYLLSLAVFMPLSGWLADRFGARLVFRLAILVFTLASVGCAFAESLGTLVAARIAQGAGGAMMVPVARLVMLRSVPKHQLITAMAWVTVPALVGPLIGPPLGGFIVTYATWPWIFWINVPIGVLALALATLYMPDVREATPPRFDLGGFLLVAIGVSGLVLGLETLGDGLLPRWANLAAVLIGLAALVAYVRHHRRRAAPIIDLSLLKVRTFFASVVGGSVFRVGIGAIPFLLPLTLQAGFGYTPLASGLTTLAAAAGAITMKFGVETVIERFGFRRVLVWNAILSGLSVGILALVDAATPTWIIFFVLLIGGFFRSLEFTALNTIGYADLEPRRMSQATTFASMAQQLSLSVGVGFAAALLQAMQAAGVGAAESFLAAFAIIGGVIAAAALVFAGLPSGAGAAVIRKGAPGALDAAVEPFDTKV